MSIQYINSNEIERTNDKITDKELKFTGITLPLTNSPYGYFNPTLSKEEQLKVNIQNIILTVPGEIPYNPEFGFGYDTQAILFENIDNVDFVKQVKTNLKTILNKYFPEITVLNINVDLDFIDQNKVFVSLKYKVDYVEIVEELKFNILGDIL